jgi:hypothetical protein
MAWIEKSQRSISIVYSNQCSNMNALSLRPYLFQEVLDVSKQLFRLFQCGKMPSLMTTILLPL